jgi:predicted AlkP superfamily pyrophosphatase or phosphodiesterase
MVLAFLVLISLVRADPVPPAQRILILISLDGFRSDYLEKYHPPNLSRLAAQGVHAKKMIPAFPSVTYPNHHTLATGLWPEHHGIIGNSFYDPAFKINFEIVENPRPDDGRWWGGEPIWVTAIKQGRVADCMFWPGSDVPIKNIRPNEWKPYSDNFNITNRVDTVLEWLARPAEKRPSLVTLYHFETDAAGHNAGVDSPEMAKAVALVDQSIGRLVNGIHLAHLDDLVNFIVVSDHGMADLNPNPVIVLSGLTDTSKVQIDFDGAVMGLRPNNPTETTAIFQRIKKQEKHFKIYLKENTPKRFHFRDSDRIPPIILAADEGWYLQKDPLTKEELADSGKGIHGYDPQLDSMGALFIAYGPAFRRGVTLASFENIHLYNLMCATLGLKPARNDGDDRLVKKVLVK